MSADDQEAPAATLLVDGHQVGPVELARTARARSRGLLGREGLEGAIWLEPAKQVHTLRMHFAIDVAFLDRDGFVLHTTTMAPWRMSRLVLRARTVVEAQSGAFAGWGLQPGSTVSVQEHA